MFHHHLSSTPPQDFQKKKNFKGIFLGEKKLRKIGFVEDILTKTLNSILEFFLWAFMFLHHPTPHPQDFEKSKKLRIKKI
jgi:hypothetical protein